MTLAFLKEAEQMGKMRCIRPLLMGSERLPAKPVISGNGVKAWLSGSLELEAVSDWKLVLLKTL